MKKALFLGLSFTLFLFYRPFAQVRTKADVIKALATSKNQEAALLKSDAIEYYVKDGHTEENFGLDHVYLQQTYKGLVIHNTVQSLAFKNNELAYCSGNFIADVASKAPTSTPTIAAIDAVSRAANHLGLETPTNLSVISNTFSSDHKIEYNDGGIANSNIKVELFWLSLNDGKTIRLAWDVVIEPLKGTDYWHVHVDALNGNIINKENNTIHEKINYNSNKPDFLRKASSICYENNSNQSLNKTHVMATPPPPPPTVTTANYNVIAYPNENEWINGYGIETNPWNYAGTNNKATTYGWHYDGTKNWNMTYGNNVHVYDDSLNINKPGRPDTSSTAIPTLTFNYSPSFSSDPTLTQNRQFAEANLFYWNNIVHDISYQYGFDEPAGNYQNTNTFNGVNRGGLGNDYVHGEAQDGSGTDNSNFTPQPDGQYGKMQMYLFNSNLPAYVTIASPTSIAGKYQYIESAFSTANKLSKTGPITGTFAVFNDDATGATHYACNGAPYNNIKGKIALIDRNNCNFTVKVKAAQTAGAIAVVMVNRVDSLLIMGGTDNTITIPAVLIQNSDGLKMEQAVEAGDNVTGTISGAGVRFDGDLDNGVVTHEYFHGISNRLTGGPSTVSCLANAEQGGEGWSDYNALMLTTDWTAAQLTDGPKARPIGLYVWAQSPSAPASAGIRNYPYSTDTSIDPLTYAWMADTSFAPEVHNIGEIWCVTLWDMTWGLIQQQGTIEPNFYNAKSNGGNAIAYQLVIEGLKLQPCSPGYIDARNAILAADSILYNNAHKCTIWKAFAKRGMGYSASQGSSNVCGDETVAFDVPPCILPVTLTDFTAAPTNGKVILKWATTQEINTKEFTVEFSTDKTNWAPVGNVPAANTPGTHDYSLYHNDPITGNNYYRLKMIDKDGSFTYSNVDVVRFAGKSGFAIYPNPVKETLSAELYNSQAQKVSVQIADVTGRTLQTGEYQLQAGNNVLQLNTASLARGTYLIIVNGTTKQVKQFVKN